jgi:peptidoglycan/LPS O-acetylase OafA/YrhL
MRHDIQLLRGIAVLTIVLYHAQIASVANGYLGVDIFL